MSVSANLKDEYINPISNIELIQNKIDETDKSESYSNKFILRTGRPGHLYLKPVYTAFTKTNLGSIPSKLEKTLIKTDTNKPLSKFINNTMPSFNKKKELNSSKKKGKEKEKEKKKFPPSFSSKGYGVGFVSKVSRFGESLSAYEPGPADYSPEKNFTLLSKVENSTFGKSFFKRKTSMSLTNYSNNLTPRDHIRSSSTSKSNMREYYDKEYNDTYNDKSDKKTGTYNFNSTSDRFKGGVFGIKNKNPGPGKYFFNTNNILVKEPDKLSPEFILPQPKKINTIKFYGLNKNEKKQFGFHLSNKKKNGKIIYVSKGFHYNNNDISSSNKKFDRSNISFENNSTKITSVITNNNNNSSALPSIYKANKKNKNSSANTQTDYISMNPEYNISSVNGLDDSKKLVNNIKKIIKFQKKDNFSLSSPRWDQGFFHDNASHFQVPGPAYYTPKLQNSKKSFNLNNRDFIYTNSLPFKNDEYYTTSSVLI